MISLRPLRWFLVLLFAGMVLRGAGTDTQADALWRGDGCFGGSAGGGATAVTTQSAAAIDDSYPGMRSNSVPAFAFSPDDGPDLSPKTENFEHNARWIALTYRGLARLADLPFFFHPASTASASVSFSFPGPHALPGVLGDETFGPFFAGNFSPISADGKVTADKDGRAFSSSELSAFQAYLAARGLALDLAFDADADGDGVAEGLRYAFGSNAPTLGGLPASLVRAGSTATYAFDLRADGRPRPHPGNQL